MKKPRVDKAWVGVDVDGCLIDDQDMPRWEVVNLLIALSAWCNVIVWSGGGLDYATIWVRRLGLERYVVGVQDKSTYLAQVKAGDRTPVDVAIDDEDAYALGKALIRVDG